MDLRTVIFGVIFVWIAAELALSKLTAIKWGESKARDKYSLWVVLGTVYISMGAGVYFWKSGVGGLSFDGTKAAYTGLGILLMGITLRWTAVFTLRKYFSVHVRILDDHKVIKHGVYKYIRHPAYTGSLLCNLGIGICCNNWISIFMMVVPLLLAFQYRIYQEEKSLMEVLGEDYIEYRKTTKRLIPFVF